MVRGQDARRLSEHYQLECDYQTSVLAIYNEGDPVFLCENHVSAVAPRDSSIAGVRPIDVQNENNNQLIRGIEADAAQLALLAAAVAGAAPESSAAAYIDQNPPEIAEAPAGVTASDELGPTAATADVPMPPQPDEVAQRAQADAARVATPTVEGASARRLRAAARIRRDAAIPISKTPARDQAYGNTAKALVDETIWNMAAGDLGAYRSALEQGKTEIEAAQAAGGQIAIIHRKIAEYTAKVEPMLSASKASISVGYAIDKPLEQAILEIIGNTTMAEAEKDAAVAQLGALQEQVKSGLQREIAPLQAHRIAVDLGERACWGGQSTLPEEVRPAYRAVYTRLRDALRAFVPEARELEERLANLYAAKADLESPPDLKGLHSAGV